MELPGPGALMGLITSQAAFSSQRPTGGTGQARPLRASADGGDARQAVVARPLQATAFLAQREAVSLGAQQYSPLAQLVAATHQTPRSCVEPV